MNPTTPFSGQFIGFVIHTRHNLFLPIIGRCIDTGDDDDCIVHVIAQNDPKPNLEEALALLDAETEKLFRIFRTPTRGSQTTWLMHLLQQEPLAPALL